MNQKTSIKIKKTINQLLQNNVEIGDLATWTLSSSKQGNGVQQLRDDNLETFW